MELLLSRELSSEELKLEGVEVLDIREKQVELRVSGNIPQLLKQLCRLPIEDIAFPEATLEDTFMELYGEEQS